LAMHFEQAGDTERAIGYYADGAKHALGQYAIQEAFAAFDRAGALVDEQEARSDSAALSGDEIERRRRRRIEIAIGKADAGYSFRSPEDTFEALERIVGPAEELGDLELAGRVHTLIALGRLQNGEPSTAPLVKRSLDRIAAIAETTGDPALRAI